jgi:AraC-like DNA-binding protein
MSAEFRFANLSLHALILFYSSLGSFNSARSNLKNEIQIGKKSIYKSEKIIQKRKKSVLQFIFCFPVDNHRAILDRMKRIHPILVRYLLIFLLFASPLLLLFVPVYRYVTAFTLHNEMVHIEEKLKSGMEVIDNASNTLNTVLAITIRDSQFRALKYSLPENSPEPFGASPHLIMELWESFRTLLSSNPLIADAGIVFSGEACLSRHRIFYFPGSYTFYGDFLKCGELSWDEWMALLSEKRPYIPAGTYQSTDYGQYDAITFAGKWFYSDHQDLNVFFATLPVNDIISLLADPEVAAKGFIRVLDANGTDLFVRGDGAKSAHHVITSKSAVNNFQYEVGIPDSFVKAKMRPVKNLIFFFSLVTAFVTILLSFFFAWQSTKPMQVFLDSIDTARIIRSEFEHYKKTLSLNPFKSIRQIFLYLAEGISQTERKFENSLHILEHETQILKVRMLDKIRQALDNSNDSAACAVLRECASTLPRPEEPLIAGLISDMLKDMLEELKREYHEILSGVDIPSYVQGKQEELFEEAYPECFKKISAAIKLYKENGISQFEEEVLDFIKAQLYNPDLYLTMISDHFNISPPSIQKLIKNISGQTFQVYVENRRLSRACELLAERKHSIAQTASLCGFSSANSFSRAFKRAYGFSPSRV